MPGCKIVPCPMPSNLHNLEDHMRFDGKRNVPSVTTTEDEMELCGEKFAGRIVCNRDTGHDLPHEMTYDGKWIRWPAAQPAPTPDAGSAEDIQWDALVATAAKADELRDRAEAAEARRDELEAWLAEYGMCKVCAAETPEQCRHNWPALTGQEAKG